MKEKIIYNGPKRPLIYIPNFPDIYMEDGDVFTIDDKYVWKSGVFDYRETHGYHRHFTVLSNLMPYSKYGVLSKEELLIEFKKILNGEEKSILEDQLERQLKLEAILPKKDFTVAHYQFSNQFRPTTRFKYENGIYFDSSNYTPKQLARYLHANLYVILPDGVESCNAESFEEYYNKQTQLLK